MLSLKKAQTLVKAALAIAREKNMKPVAVIVLDDRGALKAAAVEDGSSLKRSDIAQGKAYGCISLGMGSRSINKLAIERPHFIASASHVIGGSMIPVPGGVLIKDAKGTIIGAVGISGETSDNDEILAIAGVEAAGFKADAGSN
jgi:uncharacterized protein GlcG (DUF336 family)